MKPPLSPRVTLFLTAIGLGLLGVVGVRLALAGNAGSAAAGDTVTSVFRVEGMTCGGCEVGVKMRVEKLDGVTAVDASYEDGTATVTYDPEKVTPEVIVEAIETLGYRAELAEELDPDDEARGS